MGARTSKLIDLHGRPCEYSNSRDYQADIVAAASQTRSLYGNPAAAIRYVGIGAAAVGNFEYTDSWSVSLWHKWVSVASKYTRFFSKCELTARGRGWIINDGNGNGTYSIQIVNDASTSKYIKVTGTSDYRDGAWRFVVITYNGTGLASGIAIWINGLTESTTTSLDALGGLTILNTQTASLAGISGADRSLPGYMCHVAVHSGVLSEVEVKEMAYDHKPKDLKRLSSSSKLLYWWPLGCAEDVYSVAIDRKGVQYGVASNMAYASDYPA